MNVRTFSQIAQAAVLTLWLFQPSPVSGSTLACVSIFDAAQAEDLSGWRVTGDRENRARSLSEIELMGESLRYRGRLTAVEGAFSALNLEIEPDALRRADRLLLEIMPDARDYEITMAAGLFYRDMPLTYHTPLMDLDANRWVNKTVMLSDLSPVANGHRVRAPDYEPAKTKSMYFIIHDGKREPFELKIRSVKACHTVVDDL